MIRALVIVPPLLSDVFMQGEWPTFTNMHKLDSPSYYIKISNMYIESDMTP